MPTSRRNFVFFLGVGGATIASLTAAGFLYRAADRGSFSDLQGGKPFLPWAEWRERHLTGPEAVALAGTLACSSLNSQPWLMRIEGDIIDLYFRRTSYPVLLDPFDRDALIGLGACIENMVTAAQGLGSPASVSYYPSATNIDHVARLMLGAGLPDETPRFLAIANRRTNRNPYDRTRLPPPAILKKLESLTPGEAARFALFPANSQKGQAFAHAVSDATQVILADPAMIAEQFQWFRQTMDQIFEAPNGFGFLNAGLTDLQVRTAMALPNIGEKDFARFWADQTLNVQLPNSPMFGILAVEDDGDPIQILEAGRLLQRLHLDATAEGLSMQAISHINWLADREEARGRNRDFADRAAALAGNLGYMVLGLRLGYARRPARASPRVPLPGVLAPRVGPRPSPRPEDAQTPIPRLRRKSTPPPAP